MWRETMIDVLYVDDDESMLEAVAMFVARSGDFKIDTATSAKEALARMGEKHYDVVVCDYQMPAMTGIDLLSTLRNQGNNVPFIIFTGMGREDVAIDALNRGAEFYLRKSGDTRAMFADLASMITQCVMRRSAEQECIRVEHMFHMLADNTLDVVYRIRIKPDVAIEYINPVVEKFSGYRPEEWMRDETVMFKVIHPDDLPKLDEALKNPDSHRKPIMLRWIHKNGTVTWAEDLIAPIRDQSGDIVAIVGIARDMTDRVALERALEEANKKLSLLGGVTNHDVLNQLAVMNGYVELARENEQDPAKREKLAKVLSAGDMIRRHLEFSRDYQRMGSVKPDWTDVHAVVDRVFRSLDLKGVRLRNDTKGLQVFTDPMLEKVFYNLIDNTQRHSGGAKNIHVSHRMKGKDLVIVYEDDGKGVPEQDKERVFEKGFGKHTGLGLYLAREVLTITGITIVENGMPGKGARFEVFVPGPRFRLTA
jgi:PAS domain S-box-containing protein